MSFVVSRSSIRSWSSIRLVFVFVVGVVLVSHLLLGKLVPVVAAVVVGSSRGASPPPNETYIHQGGEVIVCVSDR